ncbi:hypothetical protein PsSCT_12060 [Pseudomonas sp. SCT]
MPFPPDRMAQSLWLKATNTEPTLRRAENIDGKIARLPRSRAALMCGNPGKALQACAAERAQFRNRSARGFPQVPAPGEPAGRSSNGIREQAHRAGKADRSAGNGETEKRRNAGITPRGDQYICG